MDKKTIDTYDKLAKEYDDETIDFWQRFPRTFLDKFIALAHGQVLDIGSGPGRDGLLLQAGGLDVTCLDASRAMIKLSKAKGLKSVLGDFMALPFDDKSFDAVWSYTSLLHTPKSEIQKAIAEIKRVLKNDGLLALGMIEGDHEEYRESAGVNLPRWFSFYTKAEIENLLKENNFKIIYFEQFRPNKKNYLNFIAKINESS